MRVPHNISNVYFHCMSTNTNIHKVHSRHLYYTVKCIVWKWLYERHKSWCYKQRHPLLCSRRGYSYLSCQFCIIYICCCSCSHSMNKIKKCCLVCHLTQWSSYISLKWACKMAGLKKWIINEKMLFYCFLLIRAIAKPPKIR